MARVDVGISIGIPGIIYSQPDYYYPPVYVAPPPVVVVPGPVYGYGPYYRTRYYREGWRRDNRYFKNRGHDRHEKRGRRGDHGDWHR